MVFDLKFMACCKMHNYEFDFMHIGTMGVCVAGIRRDGQLPPFNT